MLLKCSCKYASVILVKSPLSVYIFCKIIILMNKECKLQKL